MKSSFHKLFNAIKNPPLWAKVITFIITIFSATLSIVMVINGSNNSALMVISYILFSVAGISLFYSVYLIIPLIPKIKRGIILLMEKSQFTHLLLRSFGFRTVIFAIVSFIMSLLFSCFNAYMGIVNKSIWHGALAGFYISLACLRGGVLLYHKNRIAKKTQNNQYNMAKVYRNSGIITLILNVAL